MARAARRLLWFGACLAGGASAAGLVRLLKSLPQVAHFNPLDAPSHQTEIQVGIYFEHLYGVDEVAHVFDADFYVTYRWQDPRNYSSLFADSHMTDTEDINCDTNGGGGSQHRWLNSSSHHGAPSPSPGDHNADVQTFVEVGHDELSYIWMPDLHIRNLYQNKLYLHSEMARIYESGVIELSRFQRAVLEVSHAQYHSFPFDNQDLSIQVESLSHMTSRIALTHWPEMTGLEQQYTHYWPGWEYQSHEEEVGEVRPEYTHQNPCRAETRNRVTFHLLVQRHYLLYVTSVFLPTMLLVVTSWAAPYMTITALMPRIATGFISFLNLSNWISSHQSTMPTVNYDIWFKIFMDVARFSIVLSMLETVAAQYLYDKVSARAARSLDAWTRIFFPLNFIAVNVALFILRKPEEVTTMHRITMGNFVLVVLLSAVWSFWTYRRLKRGLVQAPFKLHGDGSVPFDVHEVGIMFKSIDGEEGDHAATVKQTMEWLIERSSLKGQVNAEEKAAIVALLEKILGQCVLTPEIFLAQQTAIFVEFIAWDRERHLAIEGGRRNSNPDPTVN